MTTVIFLCLILIFVAIAILLLWHIFTLKNTHKHVVRQLQHDLELSKTQLKLGKRKVKLAGDLKHSFSTTKAQLNQDVFDLQMIVFDKLKVS